MDKDQEYTDKWDTRWKNNITPWDFGEPAKILVALFNSNEFGDSGKALVPGCGQGHDVSFIGSFKNWSCTGLDVSETAVETACKTRDSRNVSPLRAEFVNGDFFTFEGQFDLLFDHTFLCALLPSMRLSWSKQMAKLVKKGGFLLTYMYPLGDHEDGPPWALSVEIYRELLSMNFGEVFIRDLNPSETFQKRLDGPHGEKIGKWIRK
jgi:hypothetical protein